MQESRNRISALEAVGYGDSETPSSRVVIVGCGNLLRGDDAVGPVLIRELLSLDLPSDVTLVDGGTAGMDVAFRMRGADFAILVDASTTGSEPGTIFRIPGSEVEQLPSLDAIHSHAFRWDHSLALAHWLLGDQFPKDVVVYLIEAENLMIGDPISSKVRLAMDQVSKMIELEVQAK